MKLLSRPGLPMQALYGREAGADNKKTADDVFSERKRSCGKGLCAVDAE